MSPRTATRSIAAGAVAAALLLPALPATAAIVNDARTPSPIAVVPAGTSAHVRFTHGDTAPSETFPAGTYWIEHISSMPVFDSVWVQGLSDRFAATTARYSRVVLGSPGAITTDIADVGALGRDNQLTVYSMPADAGDPAGMSEEEIFDALSTHASPSDIVAVAEVAATSVGTTASVSTFDWHNDTADYRMGDFIGIGARTTAARTGNIVTIAGLEGTFRQMAFGRAGDVWLTGDWDGDGTETIGLRRGNILYLDNDGSGGPADVTLAFGHAADDILVGDWDGDGKDTFAVRRGNMFYVSNDLSGGVAPISFAYGRATDEAWADDWDKDGKDSISVARLDGAEHHLYVKNSLAGGSADSVHIFGPHGE